MLLKTPQTMKRTVSRQPTAMMPKRKRTVPKCVPPPLLVWRPAPNRTVMHQTLRRGWHLMGRRLWDGCNC